MRNFLLLIIKNGVHFIFIGLQILCFYLVINFNQNQREIYFNSSRLFVGKMNQEVTELNDYLNLKKITDSLASENASLIQQLINTEVSSREVADSVVQMYAVTPARICSKTLNLRNNYFTLCAGKENGVNRSMGVISNHGVVGITRDVSNHYTTVLPLNNSLSRLSCSIQGKDYFGNLVWKSMNPISMKLEGIPRHAKISVGDSVITSGYSAIFPKGIPVGSISNFSFSDEGSGNYNIDVKVFSDLSREEYVYVIENRQRAEIDSLQKLVLDE